MLETEAHGLPEGLKTSGDVEDKVEGGKSSHGRVDSPRRARDDLTDLPSRSSGDGLVDFLETLLSVDCRDDPLGSLREALETCFRERGFKYAWAALHSLVVQEAVSSEEMRDRLQAPPDIDEYAASLLEKDKGEWIFIPRGRPSPGRPPLLEDMSVLIIPVSLDLGTSGCNRIDCRFKHWKEGADKSAGCSEALFYSGECCFKRDVQRPESIRDCLQCPLFPFAFALVLAKEEMDRGDFMVALLLRQHAFLAVESLKNEFIVSRHNQLSLAMSRVSMKMGELIDFKKRMDLLLGTALAMSGADRGSIFIYDDAREELKYVAWRNMPGHIEFDAPRRADTGIAAWVAKNGRPLLLQDNVENEYYRGIDPTVRSAISLPLFSKGEVFGVLNLSITTPGRRFCEADVRLVEGLASIGTVGIENAFLYKRMEERERLYRKLLSKMISAQEDERKKIASDIHDDTIQSLISSFYHLEAVEMLVEDGCYERALEELKEIKGGLQRNIGCMRRLLFDLRPSILDDAGLVPALENYLDRLESETGIRGLLYVEESMGRLPSNLEISLYRFAQEILTNVKKHAEASEVVVQLSRLRNWVEMRIRDNGVGFDLDKCFSDGGYEEHFGIKSLIERVELVDGEISINTAPGRGTEVLIRVPGEL